MRVRLLIPFGIHIKGDVINVSTSVAEYWIERRMVEPVTETPAVRSASVEPKSERAVVNRSPSK